MQKTYLPEYNQVLRSGDIRCYPKTGTVLLKSPVKMRSSDGGRLKKRKPTQE